jgi:hypothetical protein
MSWLGSLFNAAKVGVGLLNGIMNPASGASVDYETALQKGSPGHVIRVTAAGKENYKAFRILAVHVVVSAKKNHVGKTFTLYEGGAVNEGDVVFAIVTPPNGGNTLQVINNSSTKDYYVNFGQTNATAAISTQNVVVGKKGGSWPNMVDVTNAFQAYSLGNLVVTPVVTGGDDDDEERAISSPAPQIPLSPSASTRSPFFSRKKKPAVEISPPTAEPSREVGIPFSTVLGNIGFGSIIANTIFNLYTSAVGNVQIKWNANKDGTSITSYVVINRTNWAIKVSVNVNWSNPAIGATVNITVPGKTEQTGDLPDNESPISSASVCAFTENSALTTVVKFAFKEMETAGVKMYHAKFSKSSKPASDDAYDGADKLSAKDRQLLAAIKAMGSDDVLLKLQSNGTKKAPAAIEWDE